MNHFIREAIQKAFEQAGGVKSLACLAPEDLETFVPLLYQTMPPGPKVPQQNGVNIHINLPEVPLWVKGVVYPGGVVPFSGAETIAKTRWDGVRSQGDVHRFFLSSESLIRVTLGQRGRWSG